MTEKQLLNISEYKAQKFKNADLARGAVAITMKFDQSIELDNGTSIILKKKRTGGSNVVVLIVVAPKSIRILRPGKEDL